MLPTLDIKSLTMSGINPIHFEQYLGVWSIEESALLAHWRAITTMDLLAHMRSASNNSRPSVTKDSETRIARIDVRGTMTKQGSSLSDAGSTVLIRQQVREAKTDPNIDGVLGVFDSPGGAVAGNMELADDWWQLSQVKPTVSFVEDMMASAALAVGSQSRKVFANVDHAIVGSMGTFFGMYDSSKNAEQEGIRPVLIRTGDLKGSGFEGMEITRDIEAMWQVIVDEAQAGFVILMKRARKFTDSQMKELSRGGVFSARAAIDMGLIDGIRSYEAAVAELRSMIPTKRKGTSMSDQVPAATLQELKQICKGADAAFIMEQLEAEATVATAQAAWTAKQNADIAALKADAEKKSEDAAAALKAKEDELTKLKADSDAETAKLKAELAKKQPPGAGGYKTQPDLPNSKADTGVHSATDEWVLSLKAHTDLGMRPEAATRAVIAEKPEVHAAYIAEVNANRKARSFQPAH